MNFLALIFIFGAVHCVIPTEIHNLHYIYTALSKPISQPGVYQFSAMGILNDRPIDVYNSQDRVKKPMQEWMEKHNDKDYWEKGTQSRRSKEQWFNINVNILMERMQQNKSDVHILQWKHGCEVEKTAEGKMQFRNGFDQYGYDGKDFLSFDNKDMVWVAPVTQAEATKKKWDNVPILSQYTKGYLETDCVHWLEKFMQYQNQQLRTLSPPEVHIFSMKSAQSDFRTLVCLATGFYPKDVSVDILKDGVPLRENDGVTSSGVRPNGDPVETYQLRKTLEVKASDTSKYSCKVTHVTLQKPIEEFWDGQCSNCGGGSAAIIVGAVVALALLGGVVAAVLFILHKKRRVIEVEPREWPSNGQKEPLTQAEPNPQPPKNEKKGSLDSGKGASSQSSSEESVPLRVDAPTEGGNVQSAAGLGDVV